MFARIRYLLAAFDRLEFDEAGLSLRLDGFLRLSPFTPSPQRKRTTAGMPEVRIS